jgi:hypothetical protein
VWRGLPLPLGGIGTSNIESTDNIKNNPFYFHVLTGV